MSRACVAVLTFLSATSLPAQAPVRLHTLLQAEDARPRALAQLAPLFAAIHQSDPALVRVAVRGLGRQERADLIDSIAPLLAHPDRVVRAEAANALGQSALRERTADARRILEDRVALEQDALPLGALFRTLGRLPASSREEADRTETLLVRALGRVMRDSAGAVAGGAAHGLHSLWRRTAADRAVSVEAIERLVELLAMNQPAPVRRLAMEALVVSQRTDSGLLLDALRDPEREVRRLAIFAAFNQAILAGRERLVRRAWRDADAGVRFEALRAFARHMAPREGCAPVLEALEDPDIQVRLLAIDLLGGCGPAAAGRLASLADEAADADAWQAPAHALVALARVAPETANPRLARAVRSPIGWIRRYAARAADLTRNLPLLETLGRDSEPNVREAALDALSRLAGHRADSLYRAALASPDYQLVRTAALALDSTPDRSALAPLLGALTRITRERRETSRDTRAALLAALGTLGDSTLVSRLRPWLSDFDPAIARQAAELIGRWSGAPAAPSPRPLAQVPVPPVEDLERMARARVTFVMKDGGRIVLRLRPFDAPTNAARLVRMASTGWFDGLTFHRVAPNFVVQGGSPGANEYAGDGPFTRDELGLGHHVRGTVGVSTRGRDTGDGQIFINLVDNYRLDHDYTLIAEVVEGMEVVDRLVEGAVIARTEVTP